MGVEFVVEVEWFIFVLVVLDGVYGEDEFVYVCSWF